MLWAHYMAVGRASGGGGVGGEGGRWGPSVGGWVCPTGFA